MLLRVGDGVAALATTGAVGNLVEMDTAGVVAQTVALPAVSGIVDGVVRGSCTLQGSATTDVPMSRFGNGGGLAIGCYNVLPAAATFTSLSRTAAVVDWAGNVDTSTTFSMGASEYLRSIASADGSSFFLGGSVGVKVVPRGAQRARADAVTNGTFSLRSAAIDASGALYATVGACVPRGGARVRQGAAS